MSVLRRGYVPVEPDTTGFDDKLKEQFRKQDPGGKAGKQLGGQLNRALKRLDLVPIDVKADPKQALAAINSTENRLRRLAADAPTVEIKIQTEKALGQLGRFKKQLGDVAPEAATGFAARFGARLGPLLASTPMSPGLAAAAGAAALIAAPAVAATLAGAVVGAAGVGGVVGGVALAARHPDVKSAGRDLGEFVVGDLERRAAGFVPVTLAGIVRIRRGFAEMGPDLDRVFKSSRFVEPLVDGAIKGARGFIAGFADAVDNADPVITAISSMVGQLGTVTGDTFRLLAQDADEGASAIADLTQAISSFVTVSGQIIHAGAAVKGFTDQVDIALDKGRYWLEDWLSNTDAITGTKKSLDLTADGFARGSLAAESYRAATLGTASAADFATLKTAGMTDAQILAIDASGRYRAQLDQVRTATLQAAAANGTLVAATDDVKTVQDALTQAQKNLTFSLDAMGGGAGRATLLVDSLRKATQNLYGAQIGAMEANEGYEASWDALSDAVKRNKGSLDIHTAAGRANRDALQALLTKSNEMYFADIQAGVAIDEARKKHERRTTRIRQEAGQLKLNKTETQKLINTYGAIPAKKETDLVLDGVKAVVRGLQELYVYQRSLAEGIPLKSARALLTAQAGPQNAGKGGGGYASGGAYDGQLPGPASRVDNLRGYDIDTGRSFGLAGGEFIVNAEQTARHKALLEDINDGRMGFAAGGRYPVDTSRNWPYEVEAGKTKIYSRAQVARAVVPAGPPGGRTSDWIVRAARLLVPGIRVLSKDRPGARTLSGNVSYHARGRAVDFAPSEKLARLWNERYKARTKELISPYQRYNIHNGQRHTYTGAVWNQHNFAGGNAHDHIAMAGGGVIREPVVGVGASGRSYSFGERGPETVTPGIGTGDIHLHFHDSVIVSKKHAEDLVVAGWNAAKKNRRIP